MPPGLSSAPKILPSLRRMNLTYLHRPVSEHASSTGWTYLACRAVLSTVRVQGSIRVPEAELSWALGQVSLESELPAN